MKKAAFFTILFFVSSFLLFPQNSYKQDYLPFLKKIPEIKSIEAVYRFYDCSDNSCNTYKTAKAKLDIALKDLTAAELAVNNSMTTGSPGSPMTEEEANALSEKLAKMTPEEQQAWAMQNAIGAMGGVSVHSNQDKDNEAVNDAVEYSKEKSAQDYESLKKQGVNMKSDEMIIQEQLNLIENKYKQQKESLKKALDAVCGGGGEASEQEIEKCNKAYAEYKKNITPVYNAELNEKLTYIAKLVADLTAKYINAESKVAATHYGDDALEPINKNLIIGMQKEVLLRVMQVYNYFEIITLDFANNYTELEKVDQVKAFGE
jgi:hypothetical protein